MSDAAFDIAAGGMAAERSAMDVIAQSLAGAGSTRSDRNASLPGASEFVPALFSSALDDALSFAGAFDVEMPFGSVAGPFVPQAAPVTGGPRTDGDPIGQMIALVATGRAYDADVAALQAAKQMDVEALDIDKF